MKRPLLYIILVASITLSAQAKKTKRDPFIEKQRREGLIKLIGIAGEQAHYQAVPIDDAFSEKVFNNYIEYMDYSKRFFTKEDMDYLKQFRFMIDDMIRNPSLQFYNEVYTLYKEREKNIEGYFEKILKKPFNYNKLDVLETDYDKLKYATNLQGLESRWKKYLKYTSLNKYMSLKEAEETKKKADTTGKFKLSSNKKLEKESREHTLKNVRKWYKRLVKQKEKDWFNGYLNQIAERFDPHTNYMGPRDQKDFNQSMSGRLEGIGARLTERDGYIQVVEILVGSPAWKQGDLEVGDKILSVAQGTKKPLDVVNMPLEDAIEFIKGKKGTKVNLTVKKIDGMSKVIGIVRDVIEIEETFVKSAVIENKGKKYGLINLPKFYVSLDRSIAGRDCSEDVKQELIKLKKEKVEGIIVDLRNNGGGSLQEAVEIVGHFIPSGPVVQVKELGKEALVLEDLKKEIVWDGPLTVLVNKFTASASEIFAAAIQDYNRGVIIGSNKTFGKGTVQTVMDIDRRVPDSWDVLKPLGAFKMTIQKFYRINGGSTQLMGVTPDIILPTRYAYTEVGEESYDGALPWDSIEPADYQFWTRLNLDDDAKNKVVYKSKLRTKKSDYFRLVNENAKWLKKRKDDSQIRISEKAFEDDDKLIDKENEKFKKIRDLKTDLVVRISKSEKMQWKENKAFREKRQRWLDVLKDDFYIQESTVVLNEISKKQ